VREKRIASITIAGLILFGATTVCLRRRARLAEGLHPRASVWRLSCTVRCRASAGNARFAVAVPQETRFCRVIRQDFEHPGMHATTLRNPGGGRLYVSCSARKPGSLRFVARHDIHLNPESMRGPPRTPQSMDALRRAHFLRAEKTVQTNDEIVRATMARLRGAGKMRKEALLARAFEHCTTQIAVDPRSDTNDAAGALRQGIATPLGQARAMVALCRTAKIPARLVAGFVLADSLQAQPHVWVETLTGKHWMPYDTVDGYERQLPPSYLPVRRDGASVVSAKSGVGELDVGFSLHRITPPRGLSRMKGRRPSDMLDLTRLPLGLRNTLSLVLLLPFGALLTALCRNLLGLQTFGTFTPSLLALSFIYADWQTGLLLCVTVLLVGFAARTFLECMKLLMVPRLSIILTVVVIVMTFGLSALHYLNAAPGDRAVLLPLVILTMLIERFHITDQEDGAVEAVKLLAQTFLVAFCCFLLLRWESLGRLLLAHPEIHCFTLAALVWVGRYAGYRLTELWRFRDLVGPGREEGPGR